MLEATAISIPAWFVVFIVFPLVSYILLGRWNESEKRKHRLSLLAEGAAEETLRVDNMAVSSVMPVAHVPTNSGFHQCARCFSPAKTRCSQCKAVRYCSGRCQIIHWRHVHKFECLQLGKDSQSSSASLPMLSGASGGMHACGETSERYPVTQQMSGDNASSQDIFPPALTTIPSAATSSMMSGASLQSAEMSTFLNGNSDFSRTVDGSAFMNYEEASGIGFTRPIFSEPLDDTYLKDTGLFLSQRHASIPPESGMMEEGSSTAFHVQNNIENSGVSNTAIGGASAHDVQMELMEGGYSFPTRIPYIDETKVLTSSSGRTLIKRSNKVRTISNSQGTELHTPKSRVKASKDSPFSDTNMNVQAVSDSSAAGINNNVPLQESNRIANLEVMRSMGLKKSEKFDYQNHSVDSASRQTRMKMSFSYVEFVKYFQSEVFGVAPRGLLNCGNSCYVNAVLQCLMCTKPVITYLLCQSHSRAGCVKDWCLICELEQLVLMLRESSGPLSPGNIIMYIRSLNSQIGDGSPEDAHEFLRLLVASMQSICLESFGGENAIDPKLQDTTFVQHTFGGWLRSKVTCLGCNHESERYERMMDLTLEIYGQVESLEDALMQFTSPEDLDGDNMYRCQRCATYVRARKQLNIQVAPNVLTVVLKRFQEGNYGKIDKYIAFPEMLDMVPFMTGIGDLPPPYFLYAVVVHLDTPDAAFSGHYISYVKDLQGNWSRVDDTEVATVDLSQVMLEEAYILFYMRSNPRPTRGNAKAIRQQAPGFLKPRPSPSRNQRSLRPEQCKENHTTEVHKPSPKLEPNHKLETNVAPTIHSSGFLIKENQIQHSMLKNYREFSDSSEWSIFTNSDDSSFTTESARDSFSTVDHAEAAAPYSSVFRSLPATDRKAWGTISCSMFPNSMPRTRFVREEKGFVVASPALPGGASAESASVGHTAAAGMYNGVE